MRILVTGGAGYIGSHTCVELLQAGYEVVVVDNLSNSKAEALQRVQQISGKSLVFHQIDLRDRPALQKAFLQQPVDGVIHFAGFKAVGESVAEPLKYFNNNIGGTVVLCEVMSQLGIKNLVFSSSATVYGYPASVPVREDAPLQVLNPYGRTKLVIEELLSDLCRADPEWNVARLRYFNPSGAHPSGRIGEDPTGIPNNLVPYIARVAGGLYPFLRVWGNDYPTPDGTCLRDYIHVVDLAVGHLRAIEKLQTHPGLVTYNLGTGRGSSVLEMVAAFEKACGQPIPYQFLARRPGDAPSCYADPSLANKELGWQAQRSIDEMCADTWRWQTNNPIGYE